MSPRQQACLRAIVRLTKRDGYPPTVRELAAELKVTRNAISEMLKRLRRDGLIAHAAGKARTIRIIEVPRGT